MPRTKLTAVNKCKKAPARIPKDVAFSTVQPSTFHLAMYGLKSAQRARQVRQEQERERARFASVEAGVLLGYAYEGWSSAMADDPRLKRIVRSAWKEVIGAIRVWNKYMWKLYERVQQRLCTAGGAGRTLDLRAFEMDNNA